MQLDLTQTNRRQGVGTKTLFDVMKEPQHLTYQQILDVIGASAQCVSSLDEIVTYIKGLNLALKLLDSKALVAESDPIEDIVCDILQEAVQLNDTAVEIVQNGLRNRYLSLACANDQPTVAFGELIDCFLEHLSPSSTTPSGDILQMYSKLLEYPQSCQDRRSDQYIHDLHRACHYFELGERHRVVKTLASSPEILDEYNCVNLLLLLLRYDLPGVIELATKSLGRIQKGEAQLYDRYNVSVTSLVLTACQLESSVWIPSPAVLMGGSRAKKLHLLNTRSLKDMTRVCRWDAAFAINCIVYGQVSGLIALMCLNNTGEEKLIDIYEKLPDASSRWHLIAAQRIVVERLITSPDWIKRFDQLVKSVDSNVELNLRENMRSAAHQRLSDLLSATSLLSEVTVLNLKPSDSLLFDSLTSTLSIEECSIPRMLCFDSEMSERALHEAFIVRIRCKSNGGYMVLTPKEEQLLFECIRLANLRKNQVVFEQKDEKTSALLFRHAFIKLQQPPTAKLKQMFQNANSRHLTESTGKGLESVQFSVDRLAEVRTLALSCWALTCRLMCGICGQLLRCMLKYRLSSRKSAQIDAFCYQMGHWIGRLRILEQFGQSLDEIQELQLILLKEIASFSKHAVHDLLLLYFDSESIDLQVKVRYTELCSFVEDSKGYISESDIEAMKNTNPLYFDPVFDAFLMMICTRRERRVSENMFTIELDSEMDCSLLPPPSTPVLDSPPKKAVVKPLKYSMKTIDPRTNELRMLGTTRTIHLEAKDFISTETEQQPVEDLWPVMEPIEIEHHKKSVESVGTCTHSTAPTRLVSDFSQEVRMRGEQKAIIRHVVRNLTHYIEDGAGESFLHVATTTTKPHRSVPSPVSDTSERILIPQASKIRDSDSRKSRLENMHGHLREMDATLKFIETAADSIDEELSGSQSVLNQIAEIQSSMKSYDLAHLSTQLEQVEAQVLECDRDLDESKQLLHDIETKTSSNVFVRTAQKDAAEARRLLDLLCPFQQDVTL